MSEGVEGGTDVKERVNRECERGGAKVVGEFLNVLRVRKVVAEGVGMVTE